VVRLLGIPPRLEGATELLDRPGNSDREIRENLRDLERLNRLFGGARAVLAPLHRWLGHPAEGPFRILDIGTGAADIPRAICRWARRRRIALRVEAVDRNEQVLAAAAEWTAAYPEIRLRRAEVPPLPCPDRSFDCAVASQVLHHLSWAEAVSLLREMGRVARRGIIVSDVARSRRARVLAALGARLLCRSRLTRHDAPLSIRCAFGPEEVRAMAKEAGLRDATVTRQPWFRLVLVAPARCLAPISPQVVDIAGGGM
jgi:ubiquinone/menaquinone biosynthesis C-methylase UbiE